VIAMSQLALKISININTENNNNNRFWREAGDTQNTSCPNSTYFHVVGATDRLGVEGGGGKSSKISKPNVSQWARSVKSR